MGRETELSAAIIVHTVVTNVEGQAKDDEWGLTSLQQDHAFSSFFINFHDVVTRLNRQPPTLKHEMQIWHLVGAFREKKAIAGIVARDPCENQYLADERIEERVGHLDRWRRGVENRVDFTIFDVGCLKVRHRVTVREISKGESLARSRPEEIIHETNVA